ncbi:MAG: TonB-dependent receptor [Acidobacteria bacterium]|nr:TonB-dependent receptor [Acidobacteriota bacterium]
MRRSLGIIALAMMFAVSAYAQQPTSGTLQGIVADQEGNALPGATVSINGPLGTRGTQTDANGNFEFRFIPAGTYTVRAEMSGYATVEVSRVEVNIGQRTRLPITLLPGQTEEVTVTSAAPLMDPKRIEVVTNFKTDQAIETLPLGRNFTDAVAFAPGVVSGLGTGQGNYSISGSSGLENSYIIDGVNITDSGYGGVGSYSIQYGSLGTGITTDFLEEIQVKTAGFEAEFGQALGGVVNGVVKSGTNELAGSVRAYVAPGSWEAHGKDVSLVTGAINSDENEELDFGISAGGPIVKDRLFWFVAYNPVRTSTLFTVQDVRNPILDLDPGASETYPTAHPFRRAGGGFERQRDRDNYAAKFNWLATPNHRIELTAFGDPSDGDGNVPVRFTTFGMAGGPTPVNARGFRNGGGRSTIDYGADQQSLRYNGLFGADWFLEAQVSHRENEFNEDDASDEFGYSDTRVTREWAYGGTIPYGLNLLGGGSGFISATSDETWDYSLKLSKVLGSHELKVGAEYFDLEYQQIPIYSGPSTVFPFPGDLDNNGEVDTDIPIRSTSGATVTIRGGIPGCDACAFSNSAAPVQYRVTRARFNPLQEPVTGEELAFFVQDTWTLNDQWVVKLGLRSSSQELAGSGGFTFPLAVNEFGLFTDDPTTYNPRTYKFDTEISPRVGVSFDPWANGKTKLFANYARYFERVPADLAVRQFSNEIGVSVFTFADPDLTVRLSNAVATQGLEPGVVADDTKLPYVDEIVVGWQQLLRPDLSLEVRGIYRDQGRVLEDVQFATIEEIQNLYYGDLAGLPRPFPQFGAAPFGAYVLANPGDNTPSTLPTLTREYKAMELELNKRLANNWQFRANYRYSRLRGNYEGLFRNDNGQSDPNITSLADFPNSPLTRGQFQEGPLNSDRPHVLHLLGTYVFDNGWEIGGGFNWQSGVPRTALLAHPKYLNSGEIPGQDPQYLSFNPDANAWEISSTCSALSALFGECFLGDYTDAPRGSLGRTPDSASIDLHLGWQRPISDTRLKLTLDVFNVFNNQEVELLNDAVESQAALLNPNFNKILSYQAPRFVRVAAIWDW